MQDSFGSVVELIGKYRFSNIDNTELTRAILQAVKMDNQTDIQSCGHSLESNYNNCFHCMTCLSNRHMNIQNAINNRGVK
jgi:hypothetical protein